MKLNPIQIDISHYPKELHPILSGGDCYDSSSSPEANVLFIEKNSGKSREHTGYFLKSAPAGTLKREVEMTRYFHGKGLSCEVAAYISAERDWMLTEKIEGNDCTAAHYLDNPRRLCDTLAERLFLLHSTDYTACPVPNHTERYLHHAKQNYKKNHSNLHLFPSDWGCKSITEAWDMVDRYGKLLQTDTLLHGDYCLPNIILDNWQFSGFIDVDCSGVGDRHVDLFWGAWTLYFNLKTDAYCARFLDAYGRKHINKDMLRVVAAAEIFG